MSAWNLRHYMEGCVTNTHTRVLAHDFDLNKPPPEECELDGISVGVSAGNSMAIQSHGLCPSRLYPSQLLLELYNEAMRTFERDEGGTNTCGLCIKRTLLDRFDQLKAETSKKWHAENVQIPQESPAPLALPEEPIFSCPICLGNLTEPTATKCGHIFCKECIIKSLESSPKRCPTCRKRVPKGSTFRIYLPTTK